MTTNWSKIVTHPGDAHRDDFLACAIALAHLGRAVTIFRREPTADELEDPTVLVLDIGGRHEPEKSNFDHHQLPRDAKANCALHMLAEHLGDAEALRLQPWYDFTATLDSKGPFQAAKVLGLKSLPRELVSPVEEALLGLFQKAEIVEATSLLLIKAIGEIVLNSARMYSKEYDLVRSKLETVVVDGLLCLVFQMPVNPAMGDLQEREYPAAAVSLSWDDRGAGWAFFRFADHPRVDFSKLEGHPAILFAHKGGFIAKTREKLPVDEALEIVKLGLWARRG